MSWQHQVRSIAVSRCKLGIINERSSVPFCSPVSREVWLFRILAGSRQNNVKTMSKQPWTIPKIPQPCKQKTLLTPCARDTPRILALVVLCSTKDDLGIPWFWSLGIPGSHILYNSLKTKGTYQLLAGKGKLTARQNNYNSCVSWYGMCLLHNIAKIRTVTYTGLVWVFAIGLFACLIMLQRDTAGHVFAVNVQNHIFQIFTAHVQTV